MEPILWVLIGIAIVAVWIITKVSLWLHDRALDKLTKRRYKR